MQRAANALTAGNLPASIFSLTPSTMSHTGAHASAGHEIQACLCGLLSLRALQQKGQWGTAPRQEFSHFPPLHNRGYSEITGKDNLTAFSYSGRVKSPEGRQQLRRVDLRQF